MFKKLNGKKIFILGVALLILIEAIVSTMYIVSSKKIIKSIVTDDPELARAMTYAQVKDGEDATNSDYVKFDVYFLKDLNNDGIAEKIRGTCREIGSDSALYMNFSVNTNGYVKDGVITINGKNFYMQTQIPKDDQIKDNVISNNTTSIKFNNITSGTSKEVLGNIRSGDYSYGSQKAEALGSNINNYSQVNEITFTGTHVEDSTGKETKIEKKVNFNVDWYGKAKTSISTSNQTYSLKDCIDPDSENLKLKVNINTFEEYGELMLKKSYVEGTIPALNGYDPISVMVKGANITKTYDGQTKTFTAQREATVDGTGEITNSAFSMISNGYLGNQYQLIIEYPKEAYDTLTENGVELKIPVKAYYEAYNNPNDEFENLYKTNVAEDIVVATFSNPQGEVAIFHIKVGKRDSSFLGDYLVKKENVVNRYNGVNIENQENTKYTVKWDGYTGTQGKSTGIIMKSADTNGTTVDDEFVFTDGSSESIANLTSNIGIAFSGANKLLGDDGWIKVYDDDTNQLIETFTKDTWNKYTEYSYYKYSMPIKHIRVETSETTDLSSLEVYNIKQLDDEAIYKKYTEAQFSRIKYVKSYLAGYISGTLINTTLHNALYEAPLSDASISVTPDVMSTQKTEEHAKIEIRTTSDMNLRQSWKNGIFLLEFPEAVLKVDINSIEVTNQNVKILTSELYEDNGKEYLKIVTENDKATTYSINIDAQIYPDPRKISENGYIELYAHNENCQNYYYRTADKYDINGNLNVDENVLYKSTGISLIAPNTLLTSEVVKDYNDKSEITVAPKVASVLKAQRTATMQVNITNNYSGAVSDVNILGKVPFEGNTYVINGGDMGSNFSVVMTGSGISVPDEIKNYTTVYYSEKTSPTKDLNDSSNGWTTSVTDFSKIKSYLIVIKNYSMQQNKSYDFSYQIKLPEGLDYNKVAYGHHAVYFNLNTDEGKYAQQTEPNKVGVMIAKKYDLELTKYQKNKDKKIGHAMFALYDEEFDETKTAFTNENGVLTLRDLFLERVYTLKEIKAPDDYELNSDEIQFKIVEENNQLKYQLVKGTTKNISLDTSGDKPKLQVSVEEKPKAKVRITKVEKDTDNGIQMVTYKITGKGMTDGKYVYTNSDGIANISGLYAGEEYSLQEISATGYYVATMPIKFVVNNNNETYTVSVKSGTVKSSSITVEDDFPVANLKIEDTKVPQYQLQITKKASNKDIVLPNTYFRLQGETIDETVMTDENGIITLDGLYAYEANDYGVTGEYTLQELYAPNGYVINKDPIKFRIDRTTDGYKVNVLSGLVNNSSVENNVVKLEITNDPIFRIVKKDGETAELIPNVKFAIYKYGIDEVNNEVLTEALDSSGNVVGERETINGKEYQVIITDENGEINLDLASGTYKIIEVETLDKYVLPENEQERTYYITVGAGDDGLGYGENGQRITDVMFHTNSGYGSSLYETALFEDGYILTKGFSEGDIIDEKNTASGNSIVIKEKGQYIVKYNSNDKVENIFNVRAGWYSGNYSQSVLGLGTVGNKIVLFEKFEKDTAFTADQMENNKEYVIEQTDIYQVIINDNLKIEKISNAGIHTYSSDNLYMYEIKETSDGGFIVGIMWYTCDNGDKYIEADCTENNEQINLTVALGTNATVIPGVILKYNSDYKVQHAAVINTNNTDRFVIGITELKETPDKGYIMTGAYRYNTINIPAEDTVDGEEISTAKSEAAYPFIVKFNQDLKVEWLKSPMQDDGKYGFMVYQDVNIDKNGDYIVVGQMLNENFTSIPGTDTVSGEPIDLVKYGDYFQCAVLVKYRKDGKIEWYKVPGVIMPQSDNLEEPLADYFTDLEELENGNFLILAAKTYNYGDAVIKAEDTEDGKRVMFNSTSDKHTLIIEINSDGKIRNVKNIYVNSNSKYFYYPEYGKRTKAFVKNSNLYFAGECSGIPYYENDAILNKYKLKIADEKEKAELEVENVRNEYKITTDIEEFNGIKGGSISGEDEVAYEIVKHGESSIKEIKMVPDENYEIIKITINGEQQLFTKNDDGSYVLPQITDIQEDKHIVVTYSLKNQKLTINKTDSTGNKNVQGAKFKLKQIDSRTLAENIVGQFTKNGTYYFVEDNGSYKSNNKGISGSEADSYVSIDLRNQSGYYKLIVNAEVSSTRSVGDYAYAKITESTSVPYYSSKDSLIYLTGKTAVKDYSVDLEGGKLYYLHFQYEKYGSASSGDVDAFIINSVKVELSDVGLYCAEVETDANGKAEVQLPFDRYTLTEIETPDGYVLDPSVREIDFSENGTHEITLQNIEIPKIIVHHYIKETTIELADDERSDGTIGEQYTTSPHLDFEKYELEKDSNGEYVLPANASGTYKEGTTEVTYYYVEKNIPLTVHHYIEGTTDKVPLKAGGTASDVTESGKEGESYTTSAIVNDKLSDEYELVETPSNANGTYSGNEVIVTYYYKKVERKVNLIKYKEDGKTPLAGAKFKINGVEYTTDDNGKISTTLNAGTYDVTEIEAPTDYKLPSNPMTKLTVTRDTNEALINITNEKKTGTVTVHHYIEGTTDKVPLADGSIADDIVKTGNIGDMYATKSVDNLSERYELVSEPSNGSGTYIDGNIEVIYYYKTIPTSVIVYHYLEGTTTKLADDVIHDGIVGDNYTTGVATVDSKYEVVAIPTNANGKMTREQIVVIYYYRVKDTSVLVHHYKEGTSESLSEDVTINGKVDDAYTTSVATDIPSKYELVATPTNASGKMTVAQTVVTYYYRLKSTGVDVHYYKEGTTEKVSEDVTIPGKVDDKYTTVPASDVESKYELVATPDNATGTMTEDRITVIYYYRLKDTSVLVHHYLEGTTTKLADDVTIKGQVDSSYKTVANTDLLAGKYELVAEPTNKSGTMTESQIVVIYYYRVKDTSVLVHHYIKDTTTSLSADVTIHGKIEDSYTTKVADDIPEQYELVGIPANASGSMTEEQIVVTYYYQLKSYPYTVNYLEKGSSDALHEAKQGGELVYGSQVKAEDEKIDIDGYVYDSADKDVLTIGTGSNVINIYYVKRSDLTYKVNYLEKGTNEVLHEQKVQDGMTFEAEVEAASEVIEINGYNYDSVDKATLKIGVGENVINVYYTKRNDLSYTVNYLEKDTNKVLHNPKNQTEMVFGEIITSSDEIIDIGGYDYNSVDKNSIAIGISENVINIYYTKRTDLSYKVNYLEKDTNKVLHDQKVQGNMIFESVVTSADEVIDINGYNYDSVDKVTLKITTGENVINIYYVKRADLSYTVNYLEKTTNKVLHEPKVVENMTFETVITSANEVITIDGYNYDSVDKDTLIISTGDNIINIYYTKRNDLSYTVNYLEKDTNKVINAPKVTGNMTFEDEITSANEIIPINGYSYDSVDKDKLIIGTDANVINIYYTKVQGLAYTVNYLEKDTDKVIHEPKTTDNMKFEDEITSADEVIEIDGYNYDSVDKDTLVIGTGTNIINIYYTKRNDLSYKVNYLEKDTNKVLHDQKIVENMTFESTVTSADEVISIDGYNYDSVDKETLTITTGENIINIYYTKKNDLRYTVNYLEKDTNNVIHDKKVVENMTFESIVNSADEVITIYGYNYDSVDKDTLVIGTAENVINIYYTKKDAKVTIHYYEEGTTNKVSEDKEITGKVNDEYTTVVADDIESKYELVEMPTNASGVMTENDITVIYYFRKKATQVIVRHYEEGTTNKLSQDVVIDGRVDDAYTTVPATDVPIKYELSITPANANGNMAETTIEVIYYYRVKDAVVNVRYLEKGTDVVLAPEDRLDGKVDDDYAVSVKVIDGYTMVEHSGNEAGKFEVDPITITYYYLYNTRATVQYIDKTTGKILEESTQEGLEGEDFETESKDFANYILVEEPPQKTVKMTKDEIVLKYYYIHISSGVIEKHIDVISGEILANDTHNGNEGDAYNISSRTFNGYDLVEDRLPSNAQGTMKVDPIEVIYYYIYRTKVTAKYIDRATGNSLATDEVQNGHEGDQYTTERKTFDDYKLVAVPANADGAMTKDDITVTYYYVHTSGGVIINHLDVNTNKQLKDEAKIEGYEGDPYETHEENIPGYTLVQDKYPANANGTMTIDPTRVTYYYVKNTEVNIKYIDKETGEEIAEKTNIPGNEGDNFTTEPKDVPGYDLVEEPEQKDGTMTAEPIELIYYYRRPAKVIAKYFDNETKEEIATEEKQDGHQNDEYTTEAKDIKYYKLLETPSNANGTMTVTVTKDENGNDIVEDTTYVNYYYRKLDFNLSIDKKVASVTVNGNETTINGDLAKIEVYRKDFSTAKVEVKYTIKVTNNGELSGKANILEDIPTGMTMSAEKNSGWDIKETTAIRETKDLQPGESEEYIVVLDWKNGANNVGMKENTASIISTENEAGYDEKDTADNEDKADVIVAISTGGQTYIVVAGGILLVLIALGCGVYVGNKQSKIKD